MRSRLIRHNTLKYYGLRQSPRFISMCPCQQDSFLAQALTHIYKINPVKREIVNQNQ